MGDTASVIPASMERNYNDVLSRVARRRKRGDLPLICLPYANREVAIRLNGKKLLQLLAVVVLIMCGTMSVAPAGEGRHYCINYGKTVWMADVNAKFLLECGICHIAYPPGMLPTDSWRKIMAGLETHFGMDASLTAEENEEITAFLVENSSEYWGAEPVPLESTEPLRITKTDWFQRKHNSYVISPDIWKSPAVKRPANCAACHRQAKCGDFGEQNRKIPR